MGLYSAIKHIYPEINDDDFIVYDDGTGEVILRWDSELPLPSPELLNSTDIDMELRFIKNLKDEELNKACKEAILGRFSATVDGVLYYFSNDTEAQSNFKDARASFDDGTVDTYMGGSVPWTAYDETGEVVRLNLNKAQFIPVNIARMFHQQNNVSKYRDDLMKKVKMATSPPEVEAITW
jgi:hypothetical protein